MRRLEWNRYGGIGAWEWDWNCRIGTWRELDVANGNGRCGGEMSVCCIKRGGWESGRESGTGWIKESCEVSSEISIMTENKIKISKMQKKYMKSW